MELPLHVLTLCCHSLISGYVASGGWLISSTEDSFNKHESVDNSLSTHTPPQLTRPTHLLHLSHLLAHLPPVRSPLPLQLCLRNFQPRSQQRSISISL
jgi:hypothetical protein